MNKRNRSDLINITDDLYYELEMFMDSSRIIQSLELRDKNSIDLLVIKNSLIESYAIHSRVLLEFIFAKDKKLDTDARAFEYFDNPAEWISKHSEMQWLLKETWSRVGKEIAHLTYHRLNKSFETKSWKVKEISHEILELFREFICEAPEKRLGDKLKNYVNQAL